MRRRRDELLSNQIHKKMMVPQEIYIKDRTLNVHQQKFPRKTAAREGESELLLIPAGNKTARGAI
jgi:hypothetical protein